LFVARVSTGRAGRGARNVHPCLLRPA
jgi:hypothetical protein